MSLNFKSKLSSPEFFQETKEWICFHYYAMCFRSFFGRNWSQQKHFEINWPLVIIFTDLHRSFHYWSNLSNEFDNFNKSDDKITITIYESAMQNANCWRQFLFCMWNIIQIQLQNGLEGSVKSNLFEWF